MKKVLCVIFLFALQPSAAADLLPRTNNKINNPSTFEPIAGKHYRDIKQTVAVSNNSIIFLWYGCNSCLQLELIYSENNPNWQRIPVSLHKSWRTQTKLFYTIRSLQLDQHSDLKLMSALVNGSIDSEDLDAQKDSLLDPKITVSDIDKIYYSKEINQKAAFSDTLTRQLKISHVPAALIAGKYYLDLSMFSNLQQFVDTVHYLEQLSQQPSKPITVDP